MLKYLSNTFKIFGVVVILFFALQVYSTAENKVGKFIQSEIAKTKEYQKVQFHHGKDQIVDLVYQVKGASESLNINQVSEAVTDYFSFMVPKVKETPSLIWISYEGKYNSLKEESHYTVKGWKERAEDFWLELQGLKEEKLAELKVLFE